MSTALLGLDVGTTSTKAVLFDPSGNEIARAVSQPYAHLTPKPGWVEQNPQEIWQAVLGAIKGVMELADDGLQVPAMCMAVQSGSLLPVDAVGNPVYPLVTWMDERTGDLMRQWREAGHESVMREKAGWWLFSGQCPLTIAWFKQNDKDTFDKAVFYFSLNDYIAYHLTGEFCTNPSNAGGMQMLDILSGDWSEEITTLAGIRPERLSPVRPSGAVIGQVKPEICQALGLPEGIKLVNGGHDQGCTALGLGIINPGKLLLACGTAWVITGVSESGGIEHMPDALSMNFHTVADRWTISQSLGGLGASLEWWVNQAWQGADGKAPRSARYAALDAEMKHTSPKKDLYFLPLLGGFHNPGGVQYGGFSGLLLNDSRADMARAVMESASYEVRWALENIQASGIPVERLWMVGGAANSPHWPGILADVAGVPITLPQYDYWPALGAAVLAGLGSGMFKNVNEALEQFQKPEEQISPDESHHKLYSDRFEAYKLLRIEN